MSVFRFPLSIPYGRMPRRSRWSPHGTRRSDGAGSRTRWQPPLNPEVTRSHPWNDLQAVTAQNAAGQLSFYSHADLVCGYLCLASRLVTGHRSPSAGYRLATDAERVIRPCIMVVWVDARLRRQGVARQLVDASARHAGVTPSGLAWAEPFTDSGYHLAQSVAPDGLWIADYN
jgi:GNAT superfamily N-acetyltransferase